MKAVIVGAGPGGTCCAIALRRAGADVVMVDRERFPRPRPGETLHPGIEPLLQELGAVRVLQGDRIIRHPGVKVCAGGRSDFAPYDPEGSWLGFQCPRSQFDRELLEVASDLGVDVALGTRIDRVCRDGSGAITRVHGAGRLFEGDIYVDATGARGWIGSRLGFRQRRVGERRIAYHGYVQAPRDDRWTVPELSWSNAGWAWLARVAPDCVAWVRLFVGPHPSLHNAWLPTPLLGLRPLGKRRAQDVTWRIAEPPSIGNYFAVGDAAFLLDPASAHGVLKACMSGMMVAHLTTRPGIAPSLQHAAYADWLQRWFRKDCARLQELYAPHLRREPPRSVTC